MKKYLLFGMLFLSYIGIAQTNAVTYTASDQNFANPERGIYHHTETQSSNYSGLSTSQLQNWRTNENVTLILRLFYLKDFINSPISQSYLDNMQSDFDKMRNAGIKCIVRFAYSNSTSGAYDADKTRMLQHISQIKPYLQDNADVIAVMQAGFIGVWGEWYYTDHFGMPPNTNDYNNRKEIVDALLDAMPENRMVQLRTPKFKRTMYRTQSLDASEAYNEDSLSRLGHHNDCFLASPNDYGTYENLNVEYPYLSEETNYTVMGGETCEVNEPRSGCTTALEEMELFHWSYLNSDYHPGVITGFNNGGCMPTIRKNLGYRFELVSGTYPQTAAETLNVNINLYNRGFASLYNERNVYLVLRNISTNDEYRVALTVDPRTWEANDNQININETIALPSDIINGQYQLFLHLPDSGIDINSRPEYAVRFANDDVWEASTGYNDLKTTVTIDQTLAVSDHEITNYKVYPVPANESIIVELEDINDYNVTIYNLVGQRVVTNAQVESNDRLRMNTQHLQNGVYILSIEGQNAKSTKKIVISH